MIQAGTDRGLSPVSAECMPQLTVLPRIRPCQTNRCRAAAMLPHSNPTQVFDRSEPCEGKDPVNAEADVTLRQTRTQGESPLPSAKRSFPSLMYDFLGRNSENSWITRQRFLLSVTGVYVAHAAVAARPGGMAQVAAEVRQPFIGD